MPMAANRLYYEPRPSPFLRLIRFGQNIYLERGWPLKDRDRKARKGLGVVDTRPPFRPHPPGRLGSRQLQPRQVFSQGRWAAVEPLSRLVVVPAAVEGWVSSKRKPRDLTKTSYFLAFLTCRCNSSAEAPR